MKLAFAAPEELEETQLIEASDESDTEGEKNFHFLLGKTVLAIRIDQSNISQIQNQYNDSLIFISRVSSFYSFKKNL